MALHIKYVTHRHSLLRGGLQLRLPLVSLIFAALQFFLQGHYGDVHPLPLVFYLVLGLTGDGARHGRNAQKLDILVHTPKSIKSLRFLKKNRDPFSFLPSSVSSILKKKKITNA